MPYIGQQPITGNFIKLDTISVVNGQAAYTMQYNSANYVPASANHMIVSLNGIIQSPGTSFTVSGSTLTFASNLVTGDVINFILVLGDVLNIGTPSDNTVTNDKLATAPTIISKGAGSDSGAIKLNCETNSHGVTIKGPPHSAAQSYTLTLPSTAPSANKALITDGSGNLSFGNAGGLVKITETNVSSSVSEVVFNSSTMTGYNRFKIVVHNLTHSTPSDLRFADSPDNGSTISFTGNFGSHYAQLISNSHAVGSGSTSNYYDFQGWNLKANVGNYYEFDLTNFGRSGTNDYKKYICNWIHYNNNNNIYGNLNYFTSSLTSAMNYIKFFPSTGTIDEGLFIVYGIVE
tara:strand:+ start:2211 stop:3251 length:1041 start_codon:yes stop_codon:yes gene_type:complete